MLVSPVLLYSISFSLTHAATTAAAALLAATFQFYLTGQFSCVTTDEVVYAVFKIVLIHF